MGIPKEPRLVKYFTSLLSTTSELFDKVHEDLELNFGSIEWESPIHDWDYSPAYLREFGAPIRRQLCLFTELALPDKLPEWKHITNRIEQEYSEIRAEQLLRRVNIDPGYLNGSQVVLASTKRYPNRIYLSDGIYADLTLFFDGHIFRPLKGLTLPEYKTRASISFFMRARSAYLRQINNLHYPKEDVECVHFRGGICY